MEYIVFSFLTIAAATVVIYILTNKVAGFQLRIKSLLLCAVCALLISLVLPHFIFSFVSLQGTFIILSAFTILSAYAVTYYDSRHNSKHIPEDENVDSENIPAQEPFEVPTTLVDVVFEPTPRDSFAETVEETIIDDESSLIESYHPLYASNGFEPNSYDEFEQNVFCSSESDPDNEQLNDANTVSLLDTLELAIDLSPIEPAKGETDNASSDINEDQNTTNFDTETCAEPQSLNKIASESGQANVQNTEQTTFYETPELAIDLSSTKPVDNSAATVTLATAERPSEIGLASPVNDLAESDVITSDLNPDSGQPHEPDTPTHLDQQKLAINLSPTGPVADIVTTITADIRTKQDNSDHIFEIITPAAVSIPVNEEEDNEVDVQFQSLKPASDSLDDLLDFAFKQKEFGNLSLALYAFKMAWKLYHSSDAAPFVAIEIASLLKNLGAYDEAILILVEGRDLPQIQDNQILDQEFITTIAYLRITRNYLLRNLMGFLPFNRIPVEVSREIDAEYREWRNLALNPIFKEVNE